ncbi:hydantoin utilization protein A [Amylibacter kogurei]|uniref:Hydantoin utilization protein A n=1 Tax=Paramylibacter kogurei TaxID=1889778 RepID=A0A2G5K028_9RHOB|nr:HupE/UreJ family protein [Amylibacter kogurei]PIB22851.1 hydantoin utilization protein A [Amylibacter kogurei]
MKKLFATLGAVLAAGPALAHHPLNGAPMETFAHGVFSGIGHPVLGFDHLFFIALVGIAAIYTGRAMLAPAGFIGGMLIGTIMMSAGIALPAVETMIVGSLLVLGYIVASGRALALTPALALFAIAGLFHGSAFGGTIAEQEASIGGGVMIGYLLGLGVTQYLIALGAGWVAKNLWNATEATAMPARLAGAVVGGMGVLLAMEQIEGAAFAALGLG